MLALTLAQWIMQGGPELWHKHIPKAVKYVPVQEQYYMLRSTQGTVRHVGSQSAGCLHASPWEGGESQLPLSSLGSLGFFSFFSCMGFLSLSSSCSEPLLVSPSFAADWPVAGVELLPVLPSLVVVGMPLAWAVGLAVALAKGVA